MYDIPKVPEGTESRCQLKLTLKITKFSKQEPIFNIFICLKSAMINNPLPYIVMPL